ncbi:MAG: hypothetical protein M1153_01275 [Patescibacteria group bacterium]|nr:hypothetical protein [Patescibacteria group bacterium]
MKGKKEAIILLIAVAIVLLVALIWILVENKKSAVREKLSEEYTATTSTIVEGYSPPAAPGGKILSGYCWTNSIAAPYRADAWRCQVDNSIYDPCFVNGGQSVFCPDSVSLATGTVIALTKSLPAPETQANSPANWAWRVRLADGTVCSPFTGSRPFFNGQAGYYSCVSGSGESLMLLGELNANSQPWTAEEAVIGKSGSSYYILTTSTIPVSTVWR